MTEDHLEENYATCLNQADPSIAEADSVIREKAKNAIQHEIEIEELNAKLEEAKRRAEFGRVKSPTQEIEDSFTKYYAKVMGSHEFARQQKAINVEKFKDDPEMLARANETIDNWLRHRA